MARLSRYLPMLLLFACCMTLVGCPPADVIALSNTSYDFGLNDTPWTFQVWNSDPSLVPELSFTLETSRSWLRCSPTSGTSTGAAGPRGKQVIVVIVNRSDLSKGEHKGTITISGPGVVPKSIEIRVTAEGGSENSGGWALKNVVPSYARPYLVEFDFSLRDEDGHAVLAEPAQFQVTCMEDGNPIRSETGAQLARGANKQLLAYLVLDYTWSMANRDLNGDDDGNGVSDAIDHMQDAAKTVFLDALNVDAQVGIYEFHRGDRPPRKIADFSTDKALLKERIDSIWPSVGQFPAESRCWDALYAAEMEFSTDPDARKDEQRAVVFLSDGRDESSQHTYQDVIDEAKRRDIAFYCIGFGAELDISALLVITSQTGGEYYSAATAEELGAQFTQITKDLGGQYILRWATLKRGSVSFLPSFSIRILDHTLQYTTPQGYRPSEYVGDPLHGILRLVPSETADKTVAFLRAAYVPRYITRISLRAVSPYGFQAGLVGVADGGLCDVSGWDLTVENAPEGGKRILISSHAPDDIFTAIPFAAFGPILKFEFDTVVQDLADLFTTLEIDNTIYDGGQSFEID